MKALVKCTDSESWTKKYFPDLHPYMIPFLGKPLIDFYIDYCMLRGVDSIKIIVDKYDIKLFRQIRRQSRWGTEVEIEFEGCGRGGAQNFDLRFEKFALLCYDKNRLEGSPMISNIKKIFKWLIRRENAPPAGREADFAALRIPTIKDYFEVNMRLLSGFADCFSMRGYEIEKGVFTGINSSFMNLAAHSPPIVVGDNSRIDPSCEIGPSVIIGDLSLIDKNSRIKNSIVSDGTYVGKDSLIREKILTPHSIINPKDGTIAKNSGNLDLSKTFACRVFAKIMRLFEISAALLILILIFPPRIFFIRTAPRKKLVRFTGSDGREREMYYYDRTKSLFFKLLQDKIPRLVAVLKSDMALVGDSLQIAKAAENLKLYAGTFKPGAFTYSDSIGNKNSERKIMHDLLYKNRRSYITDIALVLRTFTSRLFGGGAR